MIALGILGGVSGVLFLAVDRSQIGAGYLVHAFVPALLLVGAGTLFARTRPFHHVALITIMVAWLCALLTMSLWRTSLGLGMLLVVLFLVWPATLIAIVATGRRAESARAGSIIEGARMRALWVATALTSAMLASGARVQRYPAIAAPEVVSAIGLAALGALAILSFLDARSLVMAVRLRSPFRGTGTMVVDFGVGEELVEHAIPMPASYRESGLHVLEVRGSRSRALRTLGTAVTLDALAFVIAAWAFVPAVVDPMPDVPKPFKGPCVTAPAPDWGPGR